MARGVFNTTVQDQAGNIVPGASIEVRDSDNNLATIYSQPSGGSPITNPFIVGPDAFFRCYAEQGRYSFIATAAGFGGVTWVADLNPTDEADSIKTKAALVGDGASTVFNLAGTPRNGIGDIMVFLDGVYQTQNSISVSGNVLTFTEAPPVGNHEYIILDTA